MGGFLMKKLSVVLATLLTFILSLTCLTSCFLYQGKYKATAFVVGSTTTEIEDSDSYIELKGDEVAVASISIDIPVIGTQTIQGTGTWTKGSDDNYILGVSGMELTFTIDGGKLILDLELVKIVFER